MIVIPGLSRPLKAVGKRILHVDEADDHLEVGAASAVRWAVCPNCSHRSSRLHGRYERQLDDQPCLGRPVRLKVEVRRFKCVNRHCERRTFAEQTDPFALRQQRRTAGLSDALRSLGYALGGAAAARLASRLGMTTSGDTVLRERRRAGSTVPATPPVVVGIDDWAITRGHRYGTIVVDLERRRPIELLAGREATGVAAWLRRYPTIKLVSRDRAGAYSEAVETVDTGVQQVADRWHLLTNLREAVERLLHRRNASLREAARSVGERPASQAPPVAAGGVLPLRAWQRLSDDRRAARVARYEEAVRRRALGESMKAIARAMDIDHRTVRNFVYADSYPERAQRPSGPTLLDAHRQFVSSRAAEGCVSAAHVWHELRAQGFTGSRATMRASMARTRAALSSATDLSTAGRSMPCPSARRAYAWLVGWQERQEHIPKHPDQHRFVEALCRLEPSIAVARSLAHEFLGLVQRRDLAGFDRWLARARACDVPELRRFASSLTGDLSAVRAAFDSPWSNGQVEGQINRLKFLKRQMYGRAKIDLLRLRVLHPN